MSHTNLNFWITIQMVETFNSNLLSQRTRLELAHLCQILGKSPWNCVVNSAYQEQTQPQITVIITLFNYSQYITECLDSVCQSSGLEQKLEILVIDDCSSDHSAYLVEQYLEHSTTPICLVKKAFNTGLSASRNVGLQLARGAYVFILDADNWIYPNCLITHYEQIIENDHAAVYGIINKFNHHTREGAGLLSCHDWDVEQLLRGPYIDAMAMFNKNIILSLGGYSTELVHGWEDYDLWLKIAQANYRCKFISQILSSYRVHSSSMIVHTNQNIPTITRYLFKKFSSLLEPYKKELDLYFGSPTYKDHQKGIYQLLDLGDNPTQTYLEQIQQQNVILKEQITQKESEVQLAQANLENLQNQFNLLKIELATTQEIIQAMETSKFWKIRQVWFAIKKFLGIPVVE